MNVPSELTALMSAERLGEEPHSTQPGKKLCKFQQKTPIPSYLIALVVGALDSRYVDLLNAILAIDVLRRHAFSKHSFSLCLIL